MPCAPAAARSTRRSAALCAAFVAEPLLTGLGAGGYMLVCPPDGEDVLLDFFVEAPGRGREHAGRAPLVAVDVSFGDANQVFHVGAASVGAYGMPAGICEAHRRYGRAAAAPSSSRPPSAPRATGVEVNAQQAYLFEILDGISQSTRRGAGALHGRRSGAAGRGRRRQPRARRRRSSASPPRARRPSTRATSPTRSCRAVARGGGVLTPRDLAPTRSVAREPVRAAYRGRDVDHQPAAVGRRDPHRGVARRSSSSGAVARRRARARAAAAHAGVPRAARLDHARLRRRRATAGRAR